MRSYKTTLLQIAMVWYYLSCGMCLKSHEFLWSLVFLVMGAVAQGCREAYLDIRRNNDD